MKTIFNGKRVYGTATLLISATFVSDFQEKENILNSSFCKPMYTNFQ